jgi:SAM-dependent methyltransferase
MRPSADRSKRTCAICGCPATRTLFHQQFAATAAITLLQEYDVVACEQCGFCYADGIPSQSALDAYYRDMSKYEHQDRLGDLSAADWARFEVIASHLLNHLRDPKQRIMEIGCSTGGLLSLLKHAGFEDVLGVDPSPACAAVAQRLYGIRVLSNTLSDLVIEDRSVGVIVLVGVLEHVRDLSAAIGRCAKALAEDGLLYIVVPDASRYAEGQDAPFQEFSTEHVNFFGPRSLENLLSTNGFHRVSIERGMIHSSPGTTTPVLFGVFREVVIPTRIAYVRDAEAEPGLRRYISHSSALDDQVQSLVNRVVDSGKTIIVWGVGAHTLRLLATTNLGKARISAFVDSNPKYQGKELNSVPIISPEAAASMHEPILVSSHAYQDAIISQIRNDLHLDNRIIRLYQTDARVTREEP